MKKILILTLVMAIVISAAAVTTDKLVKARDEAEERVAAVEAYFDEMHDFEQSGYANETETDEAEAEEIEVEEIATEADEAEVEETMNAPTSAKENSALEFESEDGEVVEVEVEEDDSWGSQYTDEEIQQMYWDEHLYEGFEEEIFGEDYDSLFQSDYNVYDIYVCWDDTAWGTKSSRSITYSNMGETTMVAYGDDGSVYEFTAVSVDDAPSEVTDITSQYSSYVSRACFSLPADVNFEFSFSDWQTEVVDYVYNQVESQNRYASADYQFTWTSEDYVSTDVYTFDGIVLFVLHPDVV